MYPERIIWTGGGCKAKGLYIKKPNDHWWNSSELLWVSSYDLSDQSEWYEDPSIPVDNVNWNKQEAPEFVIPPKFEWQEPTKFSVMRTDHSIDPTNRSCQKSWDSKWTYFSWIPLGLDQQSLPGYIYNFQLAGINNGLWQLCSSIRIDLITELGTEKVTTTPLSVGCKCNGTGWVVGDLGSMIRCSCKKSCR